MEKVAKCCILATFYYLLKRYHNFFKNLYYMLATFLLQIEVFLFILSILVVLVNLFRMIGVFVLKRGKLISSQASLTIMGVSISYILTMLICGF